MQRALDTVYGRASEERRERFWTAVAQSQQLATKEHATDRQQALQTIGTLTGSLATSAYLESVELGRQLEARALARIGERARCEKAMAAAERAYDTLPGEPTTSIFSFARPYLPYYAGACYAGACYAWLEQPKQAQQCSTEAIALCDAAAADWSVARALARIDLGSALVQQNDLDGASQLAAQALEICAAGRRTDPMRNRLTELLQTLKMRRGVSPLRDLEEQYRLVFAR
jgi:tetratricopeptide (TPR) repeat protein